MRSWIRNSDLVKHSDITSDTENGAQQYSTVFNSIQQYLIVFTISDRVHQYPTVIDCF